MKPGPNGTINLDDLNPGQGAWVTPHSGPAAGRHILIARRPDGDYVLIGGMHKPNTRIDAKTDKEYLIDDQGRDIKEASPEDFLTNLSHRHFAFKKRGVPTVESPKEKERREQYAHFAKKKEKVQKEYKEVLKVGRTLVKDHQTQLRDLLGLEDKTTLTSQSEKSIQDSFVKAAMSKAKEIGEPLDKSGKKLAEQFAKKATQVFRRERKKKIERIEEVSLSASKKASRGDSIKGDLSKLKQVANKISLSAASVEEELAASMQLLADGDEAAANDMINKAAEDAILAGFEHGEQKALEEQPASDELEPGNPLTPPMIDQEKKDAIDLDPDAIQVDTGLDVSKTISRFKSSRQRKEEKVKEIRYEPVFAQVDAEPEFNTDADQQVYFRKVANAARKYAASRVAVDRKKEEIRQISEEAAAAGAEERPRTAVSPEEMAVSLQTVEAAMAASGVSDADIKKEMRLLETAQNTTSPTGPGLYTVINEFWNDDSGNLLDPHMRRGSEFALSGMLAEHLPKGVLNSTEVQGLLGKLSTKVKFNPKTQRFEIPESKGAQAKYGGLVGRTSASVAPVIVARRLAQLAHRGEMEKGRIKEIKKQMKEEGVSQREKMDLGRELKRLSNSPFSSFGRKEMDNFISDVEGWNKSNVLRIEDKAMAEDAHLRQQVDQLSEQAKKGEILTPEQKLGSKEKINPHSALGKMLQRTESIESLRHRRQENLGLVLGSLETSAALAVALRESHIKQQFAAAGASRLPEEGELGEKLRVVSSPTISTKDDVRVDLPGAVHDPDPDKAGTLRSSATLAARDYARNQLGLSESEIHEVSGTALAIPKGKLAVIGVDKNGAHVRFRIGGSLTPEDAEAEATGAKRKGKPRGIIDKIPKLSQQQVASDRHSDIKNNLDEPSRSDHPPLLRQTLRTKKDDAGGDIPLSMRLSQYNAFNFMRQPKMTDDKGNPIRGSKGGLNTMVTGGGKTLAALASIADNHQNSEHMNYLISVPKGKVQDWVGEAHEMTEFHTVGYTGGKAVPKANQFVGDLEKALQSQKGQRHPTPVVIAVPDGKEGANGFGIKGWGKEQQHAFFAKMHEVIKKNGAVEGRNVVFVMDHLTDSNIHSQLTKTQTSWAHKYAGSHLGKKKAEVGDVIDHLHKLGVRGRIVDEPQTLISTGETSNRSAAGQRIFSRKHPMEYRMLLTATPANKQLVEAYDAVRWLADPPVIGRNGQYERHESGRVKYHGVPGLPSRPGFESQLGGLGRGTFTHEHLMQEQTRQMFANWNIGDAQRDRHYKLSVSDHSMPRSDSQRARQVEIEKTTKSIIKREVEIEAKRHKMSVEDLKKKQKKAYANAAGRAMRYAEMEHHQNIHGSGVVREGGKVTRRTKAEGGASMMPRVNHDDYKHNSKLTSMVHQLKKDVDEHKKQGKAHQTVIVVDSPDQAAAVKRALEKEVYPTKRGKKSAIAFLGRYSSGQRAVTTKPEELDEAKERFNQGELQALIIDKSTAAGHNLQAADSLHVVGHLDAASTVMQARGRGDRSPRSLRDSKEVHKEIHDKIKAGGYIGAKARRDFKEATGTDPRGMSASQLHQFLEKFRSQSSEGGENYRDKWQKLARKMGTFTEKPLKIHSYSMSDSPHDLQTADLRKRQMNNLEVTTPALMADPHVQEKVAHAPSGKERSRVKKSIGAGLFITLPVQKAPVLYVRN